MFPRKNSFPILCLLQFFCVAWPAPFLARRSVEFALPLLIQPAPSDAQSPHPRLVAHPFDHPALPGLNSSSFEFDDSEDNDDSVSLKRYPLGSPDGSGGCPLVPTTLATSLAFQASTNPRATLPRIIALRF